MTFFILGELFLQVQISELQNFTNVYRILQLSGSGCLCYLVKKIPPLMLLMFLSLATIYEAEFLIPLTKCNVFIFHWYFKGTLRVMSHLSAS